MEREGGKASALLSVFLLIFASCCVLLFVFLLRCVQYVALLSSLRVFEFHVFRCRKTQSFFWFVRWLLCEPHHTPKTKRLKTNKKKSPKKSTGPYPTVLQYVVEGSQGTRETRLVGEQNNQQENCLQSNNNT